MSGLDWSKAKEHHGFEAIPLLRKKRRRKRKKGPRSPKALSPADSRANKQALRADPSLAGPVRTVVRRDPS